LGVSAHQISRTSNDEETQTHEKFWVPEIYPILSEVEKFVEFNGMIIFQIQAKLGDIVRKLILGYKLKKGFGR